MRILKFKIAQALKRRQVSLETQTCGQPARVQTHEPVQRQLRARISQPHLLKTATCKGLTSCKNIMKNYSRAFTAFALSSLALPYLTIILQKYQIDPQGFTEFIEDRKKPVNCVKGLRHLLLLASVTDSVEIAAMKKAFQEICVIFLKFFSVNWIFHGKVMDKTAHLSYRLKILRKIQDPSNFISLEDLYKSSSAVCL